ncbi:MAG: glycosyltransferase family 4 protein [Rudaea sp.]
MRLLIVTDAFPPNCGGSGWSTFHLARALLSRGHSVEVVQARAGEPGIRTRTFESIPVQEYGFRSSHVPGWRALQRRRALDDGLTGFLADRAGHADLVHAQHLLSIPPAVTAARRASVPVVVTVRDYWPVCLYGTLWRDQTVCPVCRGTEQVRCLAQKYGPLARLSYPLLPFVQAELRRRQQALRDSSAVIAVSRFVARTLKGIVLPAQVKVVPNLIDVDGAQQMARTSQASHVEPYLVFVGKLNAAKGADLLPEIRRRAGVDLPLKVVGGGDITPRLAGAPGIQLCGSVSNREALAILAGARALVFPARWPEPLSRVLIEAQALGVPTAASDTGGTPDIIEHDHNGLLSDALDRMAENVARLVGDAALRGRISENAVDVARARFDETVVTGQLEQVYAEAIGAPVPAGALT